MKSEVILDPIHDNNQLYILHILRILEIQSRLFDLGAAVATPIHNSSSDKLEYTKVGRLPYTPMGGAY